MRASLQVTWGEGMKLSRVVTALALLFIFWTQPQAARISDVANTKHNLSMAGDGVDSRSVKAISEEQICVFCHTPHGASVSASAPLWNRKLSGDSGYMATYSMYDSASMDSSGLAGGVPAGPSNSSKLCLSCHDGVIAVGAVNVLNGSNQTISMNGTQGAGQMPFGTLPGGGSAENTGLTRNLGTDLTNDHPISISYDSLLVAADGELTDPLSSPHVGVRGAGVKPLIPLIPDPLDGNKPKLECVSCHDPHIRDDSGTDIKFLRLNRFQVTADPAGQGVNPNLVNFNEHNDIICLACHNKEGWVDSAHASELVANEDYTDVAATARDFPVGIKVWQAACLNCHDTHTVAGSRRLLREGVTGLPAVGETLKSGGGTPAIEETCYQCHSSDGATLTAQGINTEVPDIKSDFQLARHMPITTDEQGSSSEVHNIGDTGAAGDGKEMIESQATLGKGNLANRHVECTDCHNPHRVTKNRLATDAPSNPSAAGTHDHNLTEPGATMHTNLISGVLRGSWGVEPVYASTQFSTAAVSFTVKKGVPPQGGSMDVAQNYVTREYQVCLKCHSTYGFDAANPPALGAYAGGTPSGTHGVTHYTDQAMEFQAPLGHRGEGTALNTGASATQALKSYIFYKWTRVEAWVGSGYPVGEWVWKHEYVSRSGNTAMDACDSREPNAICSCQWCSGVPVTPNTLSGTFATIYPFLGYSCGAADVNRYANTGMPGLATSPWDGSVWDGINPPPGEQPAIVPYSVLECTVITDSETNNHRSWHPVMAETGRDAVTRGNMDASNFTAPFDAAVGSQTMYCSDCHGSETGNETVEPTGGENGNPWGPHGSNKDFLLKGDWIEPSGWRDNQEICLKCHKFSAYVQTYALSLQPPLSGFRTAEPLTRTSCAAVDYPERNLHTAHSQRLGGLKCNWCHAAVPHGWKNKALLVNLNDVGPEAGLPAGTAVDGPYTNGPYYKDAILKVTSFATSGNWTLNDCGGMSWMYTACNHRP